MVDRIRALLLARQLSPTQFADAIGVARPIMSHILSGRNKPSLEVVQKILEAFPDLAMPWLLKGTGPMLAVAEVPAAEDKAVAVAAPGPRKRPAGPVAPAPAAETPALSPDFEPLAPGPVAEATASLAPAQPALENPLPPLPPAPAPVLPPAAAAAPLVASVPPELALFAEPGKAIRRIVIFYRDGTFADYQPE
ncbi:helix-turn-helix domain-containing protein [Hymenobacter caeli]|uniref:Transcriptional regulator with XRE-family HTH domain n=1 Tax=Hymenobacter caeli TaxID=2735894 RepID=A0ABX2FR72_9BACT|nr:helix-turn-helix transcriptional regulator [Hymenobacter caeli]NRT19692.1 transcriptional regulator with XRE-family HTH domain [Hymenobacter caeli]